MLLRGAIRNDSINWTLKFPRLRFHGWLLLDMFAPVDLQVLRRWTRFAVNPWTWRDLLCRLTRSITLIPCRGSSRVLDPSSTCPTRVKNRSRHSIRCRITIQKWVFSLNFKLLNAINFANVQVFPLYASFILLECLILGLKGKSLPPLGESAATVTIAICFFTVRYYANAALVEHSTMALLDNEHFTWSQLRLFGKGILHSTYLYIYDNYHIVDLPWDSPFTWYFTAVILDFCFYWSHRAGHGELFPRSAPKILNWPAAWVFFGLPINLITAATTTRSSKLFAPHLHTIWIPRYVNHAVLPASTSNSVFCSKLSPNRSFICRWFCSSHRLNSWCTCRWIWSTSFGSTRNWSESWGRSSGSSTRHLTIAFTMVTLL